MQFILKRILDVRVRDFMPPLNDDYKQSWVAPDEVYSGDERDETPETVDLRGDPEIEWSVMSGGWNAPVGVQPMDREYVPFSIEELLTIDFENIDTKYD